MADRRSSELVVRTHRRWAWIVPVLLIVLAAGCGHRRGAMRPVFVGAPACPSGDCGVPAAGGTVISAPPAAALPAAGAEPPLLTPEPSGVPELNVPATRRNTNRKFSLGRRRDLRAAVEPFVNDPGDLFQPPKADRAWKYVVLHHSAHPTGGYAQLDRDHRDRLGTAGCGYHFVIGNGTESPDGQIEVASRWSEQKGGMHCRDARTPAVNDDGIGICLVGDLDSKPPTPRQIEATRALVAYLQDRYAIPAQHVGTHALLAHARTDCPGKNFPVQAILGVQNAAFGMRNEEKLN